MNYESSLERGIKMLIKYLDELKATNTKENFEKIIKITEEDIKFNRVNFNKRTSASDFIAIAEMAKEVVLRC